MDKIEDNGNSREEGRMKMKVEVGSTLITSTSTQLA